MTPNGAAKAFQFSPLVLADRLIGLAQLADREGCSDIASSLLKLVDRVLDYPPTPSLAVPEGGSWMQRTTTGSRSDASAAT